MIGSPEVGRTGAATVAVEDCSGQTSRPQARSVGQHPPPRDAGQERNPEEHVSVLGGVAVLVMVVIVAVVLCEGDGVGVADAVGGAATTVAVDAEEATTVVGDKLCVAEDGRLEREEGLTTTVSVELSRQPPLTQAYPGMQHPPPGKFGQLV